MKWNILFLCELQHFRGYYGPVDGKLMPMARISGDGGVEWLDHNLCNDAVKEALDIFITELE